MIHHFVGVMVCVVRTGMMAVSSIVSAALLCQPEILTKKMNAHSSTNIKLNVVFV